MTKILRTCVELYWYMIVLLSWKSSILSIWQSLLQLRMDTTKDMCYDEIGLRIQSYLTPLVAVFILVGCGHREVSRTQVPILLYILFKYFVTNMWFLWWHVRLPHRILAELPIGGHCAWQKKLYSCHNKQVAQSLQTAHNRKIKRPPHPIHYTKWTHTHVDCLILKKNYKWVVQKTWNLTLNINWLGFGNYMRKHANINDQPYVIV